MSKEYHKCAREKGCKGLKKGIKGYHECASKNMCRKADRGRLTKTEVKRELKIDIDNIRAKYSQEITAILKPLRAGNLALINRQFPKLKQLSKKYRSEIEKLKKKYIKYNTNDYSPVREINIMFGKEKKNINARWRRVINKI